MADQAQFVNLYILNLVKEVDELTRQKVILTTKEQFNAGIIEEQNKNIAEFEEKAVQLENITRENEHLTEQVRNLKTSIQDNVAIKRKLEQKEELFKIRETELEEKRHTIVALKDEITSLNDELLDMKQIPVNKTKRNKAVNTVSS